MASLTLSIIPFGFAFLVILGAMSDVLTFRIPNWVSAALLGLFAVFALASAASVPAGDSIRVALMPFGWNILIALATFAVSVVFWTFRMMGGGDVKHLAATVLWMGPHSAGEFFLWLTILAAALAIVLKLLLMWGIFAQGARVPLFVTRLLEKAAVNRLPYGFPIGVTALLMIPEVFGAR